MPRIIAAAGAAVLTCGLLLAPAVTAHAQQTDTPASNAYAIDLAVTNIDSIDLPGYSGTRGTAHTGPAGGVDEATFADPDGVADYVTMATQDGRTSGNVNPPTWDARVDLVDLHLNGLTAGTTTPPAGTALISVPEVHAYARCTPPHATQTQVHVTSPTALGKPLTDGVPVTASVTGQQLGLPKVADGTVTVTMHQITAGQSPDSALARVEFVITGDLRDEHGTRLYQGHLATLTLGDVRANCMAGPTPTPTPTTPPTMQPSGYPSGAAPSRLPSSRPTAGHRTITGPVTLGGPLSTIINLLHVMRR